MNTEWLFFDIGETLVDESQCYNHRIMDAIGDSQVTYGEFCSRVITHSRTSFTPVFDTIAELGLPPLKKPWHTEDEHPYPAAEKVLRELSQRGYKIGVIANQSLGAEHRLGKYGLRKYISVFALSTEEGVAKPDPALFLRALEKAECDAQNAVMIGDRPDNDIYPAKLLGMRTIRVRQGFAGLYEVKNHDYKADITVDCIAQLTQVL